MQKKYMVPVTVGNTKKKNERRENPEAVLRLPPSNDKKKESTKTGRSGEAPPKNVCSKRKPAQKRGPGQRYRQKKRRGINAEGNSPA